MKASTTSKILGYVPYGTGTFKPFDQVYQRASRVHANNVDKFDAVVIWGGADISPSLYNNKPGNWTGAGEALSERDTYERDVFNAAVRAGVPIIGVCRGAQLACALSGGKLVQHVNGHGRTHTITTDTGRQIVTSSVHHQMMYPFDVRHELIAWSSERLSDVYYGEKQDSFPDMPLLPEPEIVYFPETKALAIQGHPEFMDENCEFVKYCNSLIKQLF